MAQDIATTRARLSRVAVLRDNAGSTSREQSRPAAKPRAPPAGMAELVDALDSKSSSGNRVRVRFPLPAPSARRHRFDYNAGARDFQRANPTSNSGVALREDDDEPETYRSKHCADLAGVGRDRRHGPERGCEST